MDIAFDARLACLRACVRVAARARPEQIPKITSGTSRSRSHSALLTVDMLKSGIRSGGIAVRMK